MGFPQSWQKDNISRRLDVTGDGSGNASMNVNGSVTPVVFKIAPAATELILISRVIIYVKDTGIRNFQLEGKNSAN